jgi:hypothetical protein
MSEVNAVGGIASARVSANDYPDSDTRVPGHLTLTLSLTRLCRPPKNSL